MANVKNLVMGFATNQQEHSMRVFCESLRSVYSPSECDLVMITNRFEPYFEELGQKGIQFFSTVSSYSSRTSKVAKSINRGVLHTLRFFHKTGVLDGFAPEIVQAYPTLFESWHHPHFVRWFAYARYLRLNRAYNQVLLADVKDVVFQAPFFTQQADERVSLFEDGEIYGKCHWDTMWYREAWGEAELQKVLGRQALCIGTILGPHKGVLSMVEEIAAFFALHPFGRIEQAVFNYMLNTNRIKTPYKVVENISGPVATLANEAAHEAVKVQGGKICRPDSSPIPVVHMYDRFPNTAAPYAAGVSA